MLFGGSEMLLPDGKWRKSTRSEGPGDCCVEVKLAGDTVSVRDSRDPQGPALHFDRPSWADFIEAIKAGEIARPEKS